MSSREPNLCPCGCGVELPRWGRRKTASQACRQRLYEARKKAGTVIPRAERQRRAAQKRADQLDSELNDARWQVKAAQRNVRRIAKALLEAQEQAQGSGLFAAPDRTYAPELWRAWVVSRLDRMTDAELAKAASTAVAKIRSIRKRRDD